MPTDSRLDLAADQVSDDRLIPVAWLQECVQDIFETAGIDPAGARAVAESLVAADMRGVASHGTMLVPMYVDRLLRGSVSRESHAVPVVDAGAVAVLDGRRALGQITSDQAMGLAVQKARQYGVGAVAVRNAFHFGGAFRYVEHAAEHRCIGIAAANTRPLMPAPGGSTAVVGNNPIAFGIPVEGQAPLILDMALSEAALGKIRLAAAEGRPVPATWATDSEGTPTTDAAAALAGMLLPAGGHKGFGLALIVDMLTGVLSGGAFGSQVRGLYADVSVPNDCAHFFLALDTDSFGGTDEFARRAADLAAEVLASPPADGIGPVLLPGQLERERHQRAVEQGVRLEQSVIDGLTSAAEQVGAVLAPREDVGARP